MAVAKITVVSCVLWVCEFLPVNTGFASNHCAQAFRLKGCVWAKLMGSFANTFSSGIGALVENYKSMLLQNNTEFLLRFRNYPFPSIRGYRIQWRTLLAPVVKRLSKVLFNTLRRGRVWKEPLKRGAPVGDVGRG